MVILILLSLDVYYPPSERTRDADRDSPLGSDLEVEYSHWRTFSSSTHFLKGMPWKAYLFIQVYT